MRLHFLLLCVFACCIGCGPDNPNEGAPLCTASLEPAIRIEVRDANTTDPISCGAQAVIEQGTFQETVENPSGPGCFDGVMLVGAYERSGVYKVTVTKPGYNPWSVENITVTSNICHVNTVTLQATLQPPLQPL